MVGIDRRDLDVESGLVAAGRIDKRMDGGGKVRRRTIKTVLDDVVTMRISAASTFSSCAETRPPRPLRSSTCSSREIACSWP